MGGHSSRVFRADVWLLDTKTDTAKYAASSSPLTFSALSNQSGMLNLNTVVALVRDNDSKSCIIGYKR